MEERRLNKANPKCSKPKLPRPTAVQMVLLSPNGQYRQDIEEEVAMALEKKPVDFRQVCIGFRDALEDLVDFRTSFLDHKGGNAELHTIDEELSANGSTWICGNRTSVRKIPQQEQQEEDDEDDVTEEEELEVEEDVNEVEELDINIFDEAEELEVEMDVNKVEDLDIDIVDKTEDVNEAEDIDDEEDDDEEEEQQQEKEQPLLGSIYIDGRRRSARHL